jgi:hypothetical protein
MAKHNSKKRKNSSFYEEKSLVGLADPRVFIERTFIERIIIEPLIIESHVLSLLSKPIKDRIVIKTKFLSKWYFN